MEPFLSQEVPQYDPDARCLPGSVKTGYEIRFTHSLPQPQTLRPPDETQADIVTSEWETEGLIVENVGATGRGW